MNIHRIIKLKNVQNTSELNSIEKKSSKKQESSRDESTLMECGLFAILVKIDRRKSVHGLKFGSPLWPYLGLLE